MQLNEIKKLLYKNKPQAIFLYADKGGIHYFLRTEVPDKDFPKRLTTSMEFRFLIPLNDMGDSKFLQEMPAQLLIRYIIE